MKIKCCVVYTMSESDIEVTIEITSDVVCPWCWVGKRHLDIALDRLRDTPCKFNIIWQPFLLNAWIPEDGMTFKDYATQKFGEEGMKRFLTGKIPFFEQGQLVGLQFNYSENHRVVPTKKAHILLEYALKQGKQHQLQERLFGAYFSDGIDISNNAALSDILTSVGLNVKDGMACLTDTHCIQIYEEKIKETQRKGITGVPFFEIYLTGKPQGIKHQFSGAQPVETIKSVIQRVLLNAKV